MKTFSTQLSNYHQYRPVILTNSLTFVLVEDLKCKIYFICRCIYQKPDKSANRTDKSLHVSS